MKKKYLLPALLIVQIILINFLGYIPDTVERLYSNGLYLPISKGMRILFGWIPFSFGDVLYSVVFVFIFRWIFLKRKTWKIHWKANLLHIASFISVAYFAFHLLWAFNYYRVPLNETLGIRKDYTQTELREFTLKLIEKTNAVQLKITKNQNAKVVFPQSRETIYGKALNGYGHLSAQYPQFNYTHSSIKGSIYSLPLTYMGFSGYLNPFTGEAQVNDKMPLYSFPVTVCHEMAHQLGYASESEANFIGFLSAKSNADLYFQYAAYSFALRYCLNTFERTKEGNSKQFMPLINKGILENYKESRAFWEQYETFIETGFKIFYDRFLKMNQQKDGMEGYSRFVELMVNYYKNRTL
ncbi:DUF3810 domain-containing protein [Flavobacterium magnum]|uniref:DUF3810 domain-containing protein n=1 Tax=Flavobacterium magnum TaxID=2162713 RepID=A0A2S0REN3_9FLAO|nr:DUF3810 domain-containing protein [Flavobacterium magnum]